QLSSALKEKFNKKVNYYDLFNISTIEEQANLFDYTFEEKEDKAEIEIGHKETEVFGDNVNELSSAQKRQWIMYEMDPDSPNYNNTIAVTVSGQVIVPCLKMAIYQLIERHDTLRTKFKK